MKSLVIIFSIFLSYSAFSQLENYIVNEEGLWSSVTIHCLPGGSNFNTYFTKFEGDSVIDGYTYTKIWRCNDEDLSNWTPDGFIRENEDHQVYLKPPDYIEGLIYDFGVETGDTVQALNIYLNSNYILNFIVLQVDSVLLLDRYRKRVVLYEYNNDKEEIWVEGLGSYFGILNSCNDSYGPVCGGFDGLCYQESGTLVYQNPTYETCYYSVTVGLNPINEANFKVYPNPAKDFITITFPSEGKREIEIWDFLGKKVLNNLFFEKNILLNLQEVGNGIYFIKILDNENYYHSYKLIVD